MRYISEMNISFSLAVNGQDKRFRFTPCMNSGSIYVTSDPAEIEALEKSDMYNRVYRRHESCADEVVAENKKSKKSGKKPCEMKEVPEVGNWQEAKEYLVRNHGVDEDSVGSPADISEAAQNNKVYFPNLKQ